MLAGALLANAAHAGETGRTVSGVSAVQMFDLATRAEKEHDTALATQIYEALATDPSLDARSEARFRHARLLIEQKRLADAAVLYRAILDEKPNAQRVRLELAALMARMGNMASARRALRQVQAGGLPPDVARLVDQYVAALRAAKPINASIELALAPSNNINRATTATKLDTVIAPFQISDDARAQSGLGLKLGGQISGRLPVGRHLDLVARLSGQGNFYRAGTFNDMTTSAQLGIEGVVRGLRLRPMAGHSRRWYGGQIYADTDTISLNAGRGVGRRAQVELDLALGRADYKLNDLQDGTIVTANLAYERALSQRMGGSVSLGMERVAARDLGYATLAFNGQGLIWREMGKTSLYLLTSISRLNADARLLLFADRRRDWLVRATVGATFRKLTVAGFSPIVRLSYEDNQSTVGLYRYHRLSGDVGITRAF